jgi:hypothetical protein
MNMDSSENKKLKTNWEYLLIVITFGFLVGASILYFQYRWLSQKPIESPAVEIKKESKLETKEKFVEILLEELKDGENKVGDIVIEKNKPKLICDAGNPKELERKLIGDVYLGEQREGGYYELTCNIDTKAKIKMVGWNPGWEEFSVNVISFSITDKNGNIIEKRGGEDGTIAFYEDKGKVETFHHNGKVYFLIHGVYMEREREAVLIFCMLLIKKMISNRFRPGFVISMRNPVILNMF